MIDNIALGMIVGEGEHEMLHKTLPMHASLFSEKCALGFNLSSKPIEQDEFWWHNFQVRYFKWQKNYARARNLVLAMFRYTAMPPDWLLMLDADETMFPCDLDRLSQICRTTDKDVITLPRYNFWPDYGSVDATNYPDKQARVLRLSADLEHRNAVHEVVCYRNSPTTVAGEGKDHFAKDLHIYHYGGTKPKESQWLRSHNYRLIAAGEKPLTEVPQWVKDMPDDEWKAQVRKNMKVIPFTQPHPLQS